MGLEIIFFGLSAVAQVYNRRQWGLFYTATGALPMTHAYYYCDLLLCI